LGSDPYDGSILLSHLHWDHVQGIPFFSAGDRDDARVTVYLPEQGNHTGRDLMAQSMSPPAFPIGPEGLRGLWSFAAIPAGRFSVGDFEITAADVAHKGGRTFGYRVECCGTSLGYVPDHAPAAGVDVDALALLQGVDLLIHDAQFVEDERARAEDYGHGTVDDAVALAHRVGARSLALFHHAPHRTDDAVDAILAGVRTTIPAFMAREGLIVDLP
jgi:ribonuclease BN (tRNA processing enzyme)